MVSPAFSDDGIIIMTSRHTDRAKARNCRETRGHHYHRAYPEAWVKHHTMSCRLVQGIHTKVLWSVFLFQIFEKQREKTKKHENFDQNWKNKLWNKKVKTCKTEQNHWLWSQLHPPTPGQCGKKEGGSVPHPFLERWPGEARPRPSDAVTPWPRPGDTAPRR